MLQGLQGWHFIVLLLIVLLIFGAPKLPGLARSLGQSMRIFRSEMRTMKDESGAAKDPADASASATAAPSRPAEDGATSASDIDRDAESRR